MKKNRNYLNLIYELSWLDFKLKYYGSVLGIFWSLLKPFMMLGILYVVFFHFLKVGIPDYQVYLLLGIIIWNFFADATTDSTQNMAAKANLLQKTNLPPFIVVVSSVIQSFWTFVITLGIFLALFLILGFHFTWSVMMLLFLVIILVFLVFGVALIIAPLSMHFKDFRHIWDIFLQMLFWVTPIVYQYTNVPEKYLKWYLLNPIARIVIDARNAVLYNHVPEVKQLLITTGIVALICFAGLAIFKKYNRAFIEEL